MKARDIECDIESIMADAEAILYLSEAVEVEMEYHRPQLAHIIATLAMDQLKYEKTLIDAICRLGDEEKDHTQVYDGGSEEKISFSKYRLNKDKLVEILKRE